jgi:hypothetical protein
MQNKIQINAVAEAVLNACKRQVEKNRSLDGLNLDAIIKGAISVDVDSGQEVLPGATKQEVKHVMMQDIVGDYETPDTVPEWAWVEQEASYSHAKNGQDGIWEFVVNMSREFSEVPEKLKSTIAGARNSNMAYLIFHQGT